MPRKLFFAAVALLNFFITSCSYNPFVRDNNTTGSAFGLFGGAAAGGGVAAFFKSSQEVIGVSAITGGAIGYYLSTLRYQSGGVWLAGGKVYQVGDFVGIYIPSEQLFEPHSTDFLPQAGTILDSVAVVLSRTPNNNILISGNTSGFYRPRWEQKLSQAQAEKVAAYLWSAGVNHFSGTNNMVMRKLQYTGYGDHFPIASNLTGKGIRANNRIQITSYPTAYTLRLDPKSDALHNVGGEDDDVDCEPKGSCPPVTTNAYFDKSWGYKK